MNIDPRLHKQVDDHPYPLLFVTISGAHLYGFPSPDSDYDLRGVHLLPLEEVVGLKAAKRRLRSRASTTAWRSISSRTTPRSSSG
jgi:uncharacterized protein